MAWLITDLSSPTEAEFVTVIIDYVGNASGPFPPDTINNVTLSGINRAHWIQTFRNEPFLAEPRQMIPAGETGIVVFQRRYDSGAATSSEMSLDAPPPGVSQILTIDSFSTSLNKLGSPYRLWITGTPT